VTDRDAARRALLKLPRAGGRAGVKLAPAAQAFREADKALANVRVARAMLSAGLRVDFAASACPRGDYESLRASSTRPTRPAARSLGR
jgi:hypothetical protein